MWAVRVRGTLARTHTNPSLGLPVAALARIVKERVRTRGGGGATQWGTVRIENDGGAWEGSGASIFDDRGDLIALWYWGTGDYAGLAYFELIEPQAEGADDWPNQGQILPGDPPMP